MKRAAKDVAFKALQDVDYLDLSQTAHAFEESLLIYSEYLRAIRETRGTKIQRKPGEVMNDAFGKLTRLCGEGWKLQEKKKSQPKYSPFFFL